MQKLSISDRFCEIRCSSLNNHPIYIILSMFSSYYLCENNPRFRNAKILFFGLGRTNKEYFTGEYTHIMDCMALEHIGPCGWVLMYVNNVYKDKKIAL